MSLETFLRVAGDDFFLLVVVEVNKVVAVACDTDEETAVLTGCACAVWASSTTLELDMVSSEFEV